uniref:UBA domain-containing protein n=1 Tax=Arcella intermedia TaxID=1963864 RepID=A0A6B2L1N7_9EUKA
MAKECGVEPSFPLKLLHKGKFLKDELTLAEQNVNSKSSILIQQGAPDEKQAEVAKKLEKQEQTERIIKAAESMASRTKDNNDDEKEYRFVLENQDGSKVKMDPEDQKSLILAMSLHEKGTKMLEKKEISTALTFLLEADAAYQKLKDSNFLEQIDNYARLNIDIMWSILKAQNITQLLEHAWRLIRAHDILKKAYGENNERLIELRGGCCPDLIIYVRLFLLQSIIAYHNEDIKKAKQNLLLCEHKLNQMTITEDNMLELLQMGFSVREARVGLRACNRSSNEAIQWLLNRRDKEEQKKEQNELKRAEKKKLKGFGLTCNGHKIHAKLLQVFVSQGFREDLVVEALRQSDNDQEKTMSMLTETPHLLEIAIQNAKPPFQPNPEHMDQLLSMGFSQSFAYGTLKFTEGNIEAAIEKLLAGEGIEENVPAAPVVEQTAPEPMSVDPTPLPDPGAPVDEAAELEKQRIKEAENELLEDIETDQFKDYDVDLIEETEFLNQYKTLILTNLNK